MLSIIQTYLKQGASQCHLLHLCDATILIKYIFTIILGSTKSIVICISPLTSIMVDQQAKFSLRGLKMEFVGEAQLNKEAEERVLRGEVQLVYISPESILSNFKFRRMLTSSVYMDNLVALVVDEAHCVKTWGDTFRYIFAEIGTLRSLISNHVKMMALTATCTSETLQIVKDRLSMNDPTIIALCPQRSNIFYNVKSAVSLDQFSSNVVEEFSKDRSMFIKTVIFCRTYKGCGDLFSTIRHKMGKNVTEPPEYPDFDEFRIIYHNIYTDHLSQISFIELLHMEITGYVASCSSFCVDTP